MRTFGGDEKVVKLVRLKEVDGRPTLFCLPGAGGGGGSTYLELASLMDGDQSVYEIDMKGFFAADCKFTVEQLAELCCSVISEAQVHGPYYLCGYSFGGLVAYEVATRFKCNGEDVRVVAIIDTGNPAFRHRLSSAEMRQTQNTYLSNRLKKYWQFLVNGDIRKFTGSLLALFASHVGVRTRRLIRRAFLALGRPMPLIFQDNDRLMGEAWLAYDPPASELPLLLYYEAYRQAEYGGDRTLGWKLCVSGQVDVELAVGGHVEMMTTPHAHGLAARLSAIMRE